MLCDSRRRRWTGLIVRPRWVRCPCRSRAGLGYPTRAAIPTIEVAGEAGPAACCPACRCELVACGLPQAHTRRMTVGEPYVNGTRVCAGPYVGLSPP